MILLALTCFLGVALGGGETRVELASVFRAGDPLGLAVSPDERRAFLVEGSELIVLELNKPGGKESQRIPLEAAVVTMFATDEVLYIAGGASGLWQVRWTGREAQPELIEDRGDAVCTAALVVGKRLVVAYARKGDSELVLYDRETLAVESVVSLSRGLPFAIASRGRELYLALGDAGVARVTDIDSESPVLTWGPALTDLPVPSSFKLHGGFARDVAISGGRLFVAADVCGVVAIDLAQEWNRSMAISVVASAPEGEVSYAERVDARGDHVGAGFGRGPAVAIDGAPYSSYGRFGSELEVGGVERGTYAMGREDRLVMLRSNQVGVEQLWTEVLPRSAWRDLVVGRERVYSQHHRKGFFVRSLADPSVVLIKRRSRGHPAMDGRTTLRDPSLLLFGTDSGGSVIGGLLRDGVQGMQFVPKSEKIKHLGLSFDAHWLDPVDERREWFVGGYARHGWTLFRVDHEDPPRVARWPIKLPRDPEGGRGMTYFNSQIFGELLLLTRFGSTHGLVGYSAKALMKEASLLEPGADLVTPPLYQVRTHDVLREPHQPGTWRTQVVQVPDGRDIAIVAAGSHPATDSSPALARVLLFDISAGTVGAPARVATCSGLSAGGQAIALQVATLDDRVLAFVGDLGGNVAVLDLTLPEEAHVVREWHCPPNGYDNQPDCVLDLALHVGKHETLLFAAMGRRGVAILDASDPLKALSLRSFIDTPGWTAGLFVETRTNPNRLYVGDQKAGLRRYDLKD